MTKGRQRREKGFITSNMIMAPESRTQEPRELEWVSPAKEIPVCATVEPEF